MEFDVKDSDNFYLNYVIYIIQCFGCVFSLIPLIFVLYVWTTIPALRTRRTMFTLYLSTIDSMGRIIFIIYYVIRLLTLDTTYFISENFCDALTYFLYNASGWPLTSVILLQLHTFAASLNITNYERLIGRKFCLITMAASFVFDLVIGTLAHIQLKQLVDEKKWFDLIDNCKFEYFSRFSLWHSWKIFIELLIIGVIFLAQMIVALRKRLNMNKDVSNPVANSPFHQWSSMSKREKYLTVSMQICGAASFLLFIINYIDFLIEGNSDAQRILTLSITIFAFVGPLEMLWFNVDLRDEFLKRLFVNADSTTYSKGEKNVQSLKCSDSYDTLEEKN